MNGFATIGTLYMLSIKVEKRSIEKNVWSVIGNNFNNNTTILENVEVGPDQGMKIAVDATKLYEKEPLGLVLPTNGEIVTENGKQFVKSAKQKINNI